MTTNTSPQMESPKETSKTLFQISVELRDQASDIISAPNMVRTQNPLIDLTIMDSYLTPRTISGLSLVQVQLRLKRDAVNQVLSLMSPPVITIYGDEDTSQSANTTCAELVISHIITSIRATLLWAKIKISPSCLDALVSALTSQTLYLTNFSLVPPFSPTQVDQSQLQDIIETDSDNLPENVSTNL